MADIVDPGGWTSPDFHAIRAFSEAWRIHQLGGDAHEAADVLHLLLQPEWRAMVAADTPLTQEEFHRHYARTFPGVMITDGLSPMTCGAVWRAPA